MSIGNKIKEIRKSKKLTQKQLAELVGLSEMSIRRYEKEVNNPTFEILAKIADKLETPLDDIISADPNSELYKATSGIDTLKEEAEKEAEEFRKNLELTAAFCTLCEDCGFKIGFETDDDMSFFGDHVIEYTDNTGTLKQIKLTKKQYNHLFQEVRNTIKKELLLAEHYDLLGIGADD